MKRSDQRKPRAKSPSAKRRRRAAAAVAPSGLGDEQRRTIAGLSSAVALLLAAIPNGPCAFLPPAFRWPALLLVLLGLWLPVADRRLRDDPRLRKVLEAVGLTLVFGTYLLLKVVGLHASGTDDNIYFYFAARMAQGAVPYRDFFFAHPPMHLLVPAAIFKLTGFSILVAKSIPVLAQAVAGLFVYLTVRRTSRSFALCALALHLGAYQVLLGSTDMNGENIMSAFLFAALFLAVCRKPLAAGALAGLGLGSGMYALAAVLTLAVATGFASRRMLGRYLAGVGLSFGLLLLVFGLLGGHSFFQGVFAYHFAKRAAADRMPVFASLNPFSMASALLHNLGNYLSNDEFKRQLYFHAPTYLAGLGAVGLLVGRAIAALQRDRAAAALAVLSPRDLLSGSAEGLCKLGVLGTVMFTAQWGGLNEIYDFYSVPMMPWLGIAAAFALWQIFRRVVSASEWRELGVPLLLLVGFCLHMPLASWLNRSLWPDEDKDRGTVMHYEWRDPPRIGTLAGLSHALFFQDERVKGAVTPAYLHYMWNKMLTFSTAEELAAQVRANTTPDETLTGASTLAPLVALLAGRRLANDEADTNNKRFSSGMLTDEQFLASICHDKVRYLLAAPRSHFGPVLMAQNPTAAHYFVAEREVVDSTLLHFAKPFPITLYRRRDVEGLPPGLVCDTQ